MGAGMREARRQRQCKNSVDATLAGLFGLQGVGQSGWNGRKMRKIEGDARLIFFN